MQDLQFQAEMDRYDELYARAKTVAERERQHLELEALESGDYNAIHQQSDSELSVLVCSLFDGMEGIEGIEGMEGMEGIQGGTSPRCTRLGKVVKYRDD
jgi:hypothetical protein